MYYYIYNYITEYYADRKTSVYRLNSGGHKNDF